MASGEDSSTWRISSIYFFYFALLGAILPYWNLYLAELGYNALQIGYLGAILMGTKIVSPYILGWLTDRTQKPVAVIRYSNFAALVCFAFIYLIPDSENANTQFWMLALIIAGFSFFWNAVVGQYEALTFLFLGKQHHRYGPIRAWGSIGFVIAVSGLGYLFEVVKIEALVHVILALLFMIWISSLLVNELDYSIEPNGSGHTGSIRNFFLRRDVMGFLVGCLLVKVAHGPYYTFYSIYLDAWGYSESLIGWLWSAGVIAELALFFIFTRLLSKYSLLQILIFSAAIGVVRWLLIGLMPENLYLMIFAQILHAITFASYHAAAVNWVRKTFGREYQGQGQALYSAASFGAGSAIGAVLSGYMWSDQMSSQWTLCWIAAALISVIAALVFWCSMRRPAVFA